MVDIALKALLLFSPLIYLRGFGLNQFDIPIFHLGAIALFLASLYDIPIRRGIDKRLTFFMVLLCFINLVLHRFNMTVMYSFLNIFLAIFCVHIIVSYCRNPKDCYKYIVAAGIINLLVFSFQKFGYNPFLPDTAKTELGAMMGNAPRLGMYLAMISPFFLSLSIAAYAVLILCLKITTEWYSLFVAVVILGIYIKNKFARIAIALLSLGVLFVMRQYMIQEIMIRVNVWKEVFMTFFNFPLAGYGLGVYPYGPDKIVPGTDPVIYNSWFQFVSGIGVLGIAWIFLAGKKYLREIRVNTESLALGGLCLLGCAEYPFEIPKLWVTIIAIVAFAIIKQEEYCA